MSENQLADWLQKASSLETAIKSAIVGQERAIHLLTIAIFSRGHVLLEGDVGVGKTTLLRAVARSLGGAYERVEGSVDMMPTDLIYHTYISEDGKPKLIQARFSCMANHSQPFFLMKLIELDLKFILSCYERWRKEV